MIKILVATVLSLLSLGSTANAAVDVPDTANRFQARTVCVRIDNTVDAKKWAVKWAVRNWNRSQSHVHLDVAASCGATPKISVSGYKTGQGRTWGGWTNVDASYLDTNLNRYVFTKVSVHINTRPAWAAGNRCFHRMVATHELGHALGLPHFAEVTPRPAGTDAPSSIMGTSYNIDKFCGKIGPTDLAYLEGIYR